MKQTAENGFAVHDREVISFHKALTGCGASRYRMPLSVALEQGAPFPTDSASFGLGIGNGERGNRALLEYTVKNKGFYIGLINHRLFYDEDV